MQLVQVIFLFIEFTWVGQFNHKTTSWRFFYTDFTWFCQLDHNILNDQSDWELNYDFDPLKPNALPIPYCFNSPMYHICPDYDNLHFPLPPRSHRMFGIQMTFVRITFQPLTLCCNHQKKIQPINHKHFQLAYPTYKY